MMPRLLCLSAMVALAACVPMGTQPVDDGQNASSSASSLAALEPTPGFLVYENDEYGVGFLYPEHFGEFSFAEAYGKNYGLHIADNAWTYEGQIEPLLSLQAVNADPTFSHSLHLEAFPLQGYSRVLMYDDEYNFDAATKTWTTSLGGENKAPETTTIGGRTAYLFPFGDAGSSAMTYAIPLEEKGVMLELTFSMCVACLATETEMTDDESLIQANGVHAEADWQSILGSIRFR